MPRRPNRKAIRKHSDLKRKRAAYRLARRSARGRVHSNRPTYPVTPNIHGHPRVFRGGKHVKRCRISPPTCTPPPTTSPLTPRDPSGDVYTDPSDMDTPNIHGHPSHFRGGKRAKKARKHRVILEEALFHVFCHFTTSFTAGQIFSRFPQTDVTFASTPHPRV